MALPGSPSARDNDRRSVCRTTSVTIGSAAAPIRRSLLVPVSRHLPETSTERLLA